MLYHFSSQKILLKAIFITVFCPFTLFSQITDTVLIKDGSGRGKAPSIALDNDENIYVAWLDSRSDTSYNGDWDVYFAKSTDGGETFGENVWVGKSLWGEEIPPAIGIDNQGIIYIAFSDIGTNYEDFDVYLAKSTDGGISFQPRVRIDHGGDSYANSPAIAIDDSSRIYVIWYDDRNYPGFNVYFNKSVDGGETFMENDVRVDVGNDSYEAFSSSSSLALDSDGNIFVSWSMHTEPHHLFLSKSTDGGETFDSSCVQVDDNQYTYEGVYRPCLIIDAMDNIYITWRNTDNVLGTIDGYIYFKKSANGGMTFGPRIRIDSPDPTEELSRYPRMVVDSTQNVFITWGDFRRNYTDVYFNASFDGGETFGDNQPLIETSYATHRPDIAVDDSSIVYLVWSERKTSSDQYKIYFSKFDPEITNGVANPENDFNVPDNISLSQNYPNPFNSETKIDYSVNTEKSHLSLIVYNLLGVKIRDLANEERYPGDYSVIWDGKDNKGNPVSSGIYFYRLKTGSNIKERKIILLR